MKISESKKGGMFNILAMIVIAVLFLVFVVVVFMGGDNGKLNIAAQKIAELIKGVPEVDQNENEMNFFRANDVQLKFLDSWNKQITYALAGTMAQDGCLMMLKPLEAEGFYQKGSNYNLYLEQNGADITMRLTRFAKQNYENVNDKTEVPVTTAVIPGAQLCVIKDASASAFYTQFNDRTSATPVPAFSAITPVQVNYLLISSGKEDERDKKRSIGYSTDSAKPDNINKYTWAELFKKGDKTIIYAMRINSGGTNYICFFPTYNDFLWSKCKEPINGFMQTDCFDSDAGKRSLKYNFDNKFLSEDLICSTSPPATPAAGTNTAQGGTGTNTNTP